MKKIEIKKIACVGGGIIGHSWATLFSSKGLEVAILTRSQETLARAVKNVEDNLNFLEQHGLLKKGEPEAALERIKTTTDLAEAVAAADYIQESAPEKYEVKKAIFKEMDDAVAEHTILASSASGLLMSEIQKATKKPQRCVLVHPWNPPHLMPLVEIAGGEKTSKETVETAYQLMLQVGKMPIMLRKEASGYIANRIQAAVLREAIDIVDKGIASVEDVDRAVSAGPALRWAIMGPFLIHHLGGKGIERFIETLGPSYALRWSTMATWTSIPPSAAKKVIEGVYGTERVRSMTMERIAEWRDKKLADLLKVLEFSK